MLGKEIFISGIDTNCGKTYCTALLARHLQNDKKVITAKLIQTGCEGISEDIIEHRRMMGIDLLDEDVNGQTCSHVLSYPASPHLAATIDNCTIDISKTRAQIEELKLQFEIILSEGAGGLMVPISEHYLTIDYVKEYNLPLILIGSSKLGSINHSLLSIQACVNAGLNLHAFIYNELPDSDILIANNSYEYISNYLKIHSPSTTVLHVSEINHKASALFT